MKVFIVKRENHARLPVEGLSGSVKFEPPQANCKLRNFELQLQTVKVASPTCR